MDTYIQREWCEDLDRYVGWGTSSDVHYQCRRCGRVCRWSGFESIKVGPCRLPAPPAGYDASLS
jgi:hypothetical protein